MQIFVLLHTHFTSLRTFHKLKHNTPLSQENTTARNYSCSVRGWVARVPFQPNDTILCDYASLHIVSDLIHHMTKIVKCGACFMSQGAHDFLGKIGVVIIVHMIRTLAKITCEKQCAHLIDFRSMRYNVTVHLSRPQTCT